MDDIRPTEGSLGSLFLRDQPGLFGCDDHARGGDVCGVIGGVAVHKGFDSITDHDFQAIEYLIWQPAMTAEWMTIVLSWLEREPNLSRALRIVSKVRVVGLSSCSASIV